MLGAHNFSGNFSVLLEALVGLVVHKLNSREGVDWWDTSSLLLDSLNSNVSSGLLGLGILGILRGLDVGGELSLLSSLVGNDLSSLLLSSLERFVLLTKWVLHLGKSWRWSHGPLLSSEVWVLVNLVIDLINSGLGHVRLLGMSSSSLIGVKSIDLVSVLSLSGLLLSNNSGGSSLGWDEALVGGSVWSWHVNTLHLGEAVVVLVVVMLGANHTKKSNKN